MRRPPILRWIAVLVAFIVPLQFASVAVAAYCAHEHSLEQQAHFGHHSHDHDTGTFHGDGPATSHLDCELGHSLSLKVSVDWSVPIGSVASRSAIATAPPPVLVALPEALFRPPLGRRA